MICPYCELIISNQSDRCIFCPFVPCHCGLDGHPLHSINCPVHGKKNEEPKMEMTKKEAVEKLYGRIHPDNRHGFVEALEALGILKFKEEKKIKTKVIFKTKDYPDGLQIYVAFDGGIPHLIYEAK